MLRKFKDECFSGKTKIIVDDLVYERKGQIGQKGGVLCKTIKV